VFLVMRVLETETGNKHREDIALSRAILRCIPMNQTCSEIIFRPLFIAYNGTFEVESITQQADEARSYEPVEESGTYTSLKLQPWV
jgi:hypothetical protein